MSRQDRGQRIRGLWASLQSKQAAQIGVALTAGFLPTTRSEVVREAQTITATTRAEMSDSILDEETAGVTSHLPFDQIERAESRETDRDALLSPSEREQLKRDVWRKLERDTRPD